MDGRLVDKVGLQKMMKHTLHQPPYLATLGSLFFFPLRKCYIGLLVTSWCRGVGCLYLYSSIRKILIGIGLLWVKFSTCSAASWVGSPPRPLPLRRGGLDANLFLHVQRGNKTCRTRFPVGSVWKRTLHLWSIQRVKCGTRNIVR